MIHRPTFGHDLSDKTFSQRFSEYSRFLLCYAASTDG